MHITWPISDTHSQYKLNAGPAFNFEDLFPQTTSSIFGTTGWPFNTNTTTPDLTTLLQKFTDSSINYALESVRGKARPTNEYVGYLQNNDPKIKALASKIVSPSDTNDQKMYKIEQWVIDNITYEFDIKTYGKNEHWATPDETLRQGRGDCEDFAFLIHSLGLNTGISSDRLRTYGGVVVWQNEAGGLSAGGHGWTSYKRESDNEWVVLDGTFFTTDKPLDERITMRNNPLYAEDYFFVTANHTVDTPYSNGLRNPDKHRGYSSSPTSGNIINFYV